METLDYYCDNSRHLVYKPYSTINFHLMANDLEINKCWFHKNHYDISKRRIEEIQGKSIVVSSKEILEIIKGAVAQLG